MMKASVCFDIPLQGRQENLVRRGDPVNDDALQRLCIIGACTRCPFCDLNVYQASVSREAQLYLAHHISDMKELLLRASTEAFLQGGGKS